MSRRARVLVVTPDFPPATGGIQKLVHRLVGSWERVDVRVVTLTAAPNGADQVLDGVNVRRVHAPPALGHRSTVAVLNGAAVLEARRFDPDIVLNAHIVTAPGAFAVRHVQGAPFVQYLHGREIANRPRTARFALRRAAAAVAVSRFTESLAREVGYNGDQLHRIPPGVDFPPSMRDDRALRPTVVTVARMEDPYKGHDTMIRALEQVKERVPNVCWVVIGDGALRAEYERLVRERGLERSVRFLGSVSDTERDQWLARAHLFAMPSRLTERGGGEGFGIAYLEASAYGLPVVAGDVGGARDAVVDGETGRLVDAADAVSVANAITELLLDRQRAASLGQAGAAWARRFSWDRISRQVEDLLLEVGRQ